MSKSQVVTLRMPRELKQRLENEAKMQGVSINQLTNYLLNIQLTQLEMVTNMENRLKTKNIQNLKAKAASLLDRIPDREVPEWDHLD